MKAGPRYDGTITYELLPEIESWLQAMELPYRFQVKRQRRPHRKRGQSKRVRMPTLWLHDEQHATMLRIAFPSVIRMIGRHQIA